jgi:hypothetical protein
MKNQRLHNPFYTLLDERPRRLTRARRDKAQVQLQPEAQVVVGRVRQSFTGG